VWYIRERFKMKCAVGVWDLKRSDGEDIRSSGLVNGELMMYTPRCRCGVQVDR
jgi:hypothetical protein